MKKVLLALLALPTAAFSQMDTTADEAAIRAFYDIALEDRYAYNWLEELCKEIGPRLAGTDGAEKAVVWAQETLDTLGFDRVYLQEVKVPHWERGETTVQLSDTDLEFASCALGGSVATPDGGIIARVIEIPDVDDLERFGREQIEGKIVFFSAPMRQTYISTGAAYGEAVAKRHIGAAKASEYGAVAVVIRSVTTKKDDAPHTGSMSYRDAPVKIPAAALGYQSADNLQKLLSENPELELHMNMSCEWHDSTTSYNVIAEVVGSEYPDEYAVVGGHLDSWDLAEGAQDDGAGSVQSMEALYLMLKSGYRPKRTHRVVLFMNEEFGLNGAREYARQAQLLGHKHVIGIESDGGGDVPRGFSIQSLPSGVSVVESFKWFLEPYGLREYSVGWSGADVGQLRNDDAILLGYRADGQRYFDYHHAPTDTFEVINARALELGSASMAAMLYLLDKYEARP
ncbi:MAG: M28 family peptidase [Flavobacteriia bacterium]|nr:M28 family peptidase [Flavobacteriia bacterium]